MALALSCGPTWGQNAAEVQQLLRAGKMPEAMLKLEQALTKQPASVELRFLKAVLLGEQQRTPEAIEHYLALIHDHPHLAEPYNNLGVLYAAEKQYDRARAAFEMAVRNRPGYAAAHENLADTYAALAAEAYTRALDLDGQNRLLGEKLALTRRLLASPLPERR
ncbi:tetratricopeptide repeat protein [Eleftheria terrae]|uniref:tetratricopeptide repeat protein n=1 Tax=Eleftheria terrae TaxID=1597781 RepID=UPI00263ACF3E|nr:tetratricopeptide repeat protein [Eleftheria terrae]WKB52868.1 tetratricopeptide repeat protein [Eleftheria terrae]